MTWRCKSVRGEPFDFSRRGGGRLDDLEKIYPAASRQKKKNISCMAAPRKKNHVCMVRPRKKFLQIIDSPTLPVVYSKSEYLYASYAL